MGTEIIAGLTGVMIGTIDVMIGTTGVMIDTIDVMIDTTGVMIDTIDATIEGIADEVTIIIVVIIAEVMIGIAAHATTTESANSRLSIQQV